MKSQKPTGTLPEQSQDPSAGQAVGNETAAGQRRRNHQRVIGRLRDRRR